MMLTFAFFFYLENIIHYGNKAMQTKEKKSWAKQNKSRI